MTELRRGDGKKLNFTIGEDGPEPSTVVYVPPESEFEVPEIVHTDTGSFMRASSGRIWIDGEEVPVTSVVVKDGLGTVIVEYTGEPELEPEVPELSDDPDFLRWQWMKGPQPVSVKDYSQEEGDEGLL